jgi:4-amino-4-deoxy-L-arabinose transferase-like glycosyltransferase
MSRWPRERRDRRPGSIAFWLPRFWSARAAALDWGARALEAERPARGASVTASSVSVGARDLTRADSLPALGSLAAWIAEQRQRLVLFALLIGAAAFHGFFLLRMPVPFVDEAWHASRALSLAQTGWAFSDLDSGVADKYEGYWTYNPWVSAWVQALAIGALGLSLFAVRLVSLAFGLLLLVSVYAIARQLVGPRAGLLAVFLVAVSRAFFYSSHLARPDVMVAALGFGAIALTRGEHPPGCRAATIRCATAGLVLGLALEIHPNAAIYCPAIAVLLLMDHGWSVPSTLRSPGLWGFAAGLAVGVAFYLCLHVLPYPATFLTLNHLIEGPIHVPPLLSMDPWELADSAADLGQLFYSFAHVRLVLFAVALLMLLRRRSRADQQLLILIAALAASMVALIQTKAYFYGILISPAVDLVVAAWLSRLSASPVAWSGRWGAMPRRYGPAVLGLGLLAIAIAPTVPRLMADSTGEFRTVLERVRTLVAPGASVMGSQVYWFGLHDQRYFSWEQLVFYRNHVPGATLEDAFVALRPRYFIADRQTDLFIRSRPRSTAQGRFLHVDNAEMERFLSSHADLVDTIETTAFGTVRVYEIDWPEGPGAAVAGPRREGTRSAASGPDARLAAEAERPVGGERLGLVSSHPRLEPLRPPIDQPAGPVTRSG